MEAKSKDGVRILQITVRADYGGGPEHVFHLIEQLAKEDIQIFVACPEEEPYWQRYTGIVGKERMLAIPHRRFTLGHLWQMMKLARRWKIDLIHSHGKGAGIYGRMLGLLGDKPRVHTFHGIHVGEYSSWQAWFYLWLERLLSSISCRLISVSPGEAQIITGNRLCVLQKLAVIPNGVIIPATAADGGDAGKRHKVISMSRFDYPKYSGLVLQIAGELQRRGRLAEFEFVFLGTGPEEEALRREAQQADLDESVTFTGAVPNPGEYLQDAFCYLSTSRWEGMPLAVLEAMAVGLPVVATEVVGNHDVVDHDETGFLYDIGQPGKAAEYLCLLADDNTLRRRLAANARQAAVEKYSIDRMARQVLAVYEDCLAKQS